MSSEDKSFIYSDHKSFLDKIILKKRNEIVELINNFFSDKFLYDVLDIGTTEDTNHKSSNFIIKNLNSFKVYKSISNQKIISNFFKEILTKSITEDFSNMELERFKADLVISNATIEHVGNYKNQIKMCKNIINLSKKYFVIITPNRYHPLEFHTKLPFLHWLPRKLHRVILILLGYKVLSKEENLNLLSKNDLIKIMNEINHKNFNFKYLNFLFFRSNLILIGKKN